MIVPLTIRNITLGEGRPKICVPLTAKYMDELAVQLQQLQSSHYDLVEWRVDFPESDGDFAPMYELIRQSIGNAPLLATFRTANEGGQRNLSNSAYLALYQKLLTLGVDLIDVEWQKSLGLIQQLIQEAHLHGAHVILSNHDFTKTPPKDEIIRRLTSMQDMGGDLLKIAVMPQSKADVLTLLDATQEMAELYARRPLITMSMGALGAVSRLCGYFSGSALTFGTAGASSAPGQMDANTMKPILELLGSIQ